MSTYDFLNELAKILRGEHQAWGGDPVANAGSYVRRFAADFDVSEQTASDIEKNIQDCSDVSGLPPSRLYWVINTIRECKS